MLHTTMATTETSRDTYSLIRPVGSPAFSAPYKSVRHFVRVYASVSVRVKAVCRWKLFKWCLLRSAENFISAMTPTAVPKLDCWCEYSMLIRIRMYFVYFVCICDTPVRAFRFICLSFPFASHTISFWREKKTLNCRAMLLVRKWRIVHCCSGKKRWREMQAPFWKRSCCHFCSTACPVADSYP